MTEVFDRRDARQVAVVTGLVVTLTVASVLWLTVRAQYRADFDEELFASSRLERLERVQSLSDGFLSQETSAYRGTFDTLVDRVWAIYYPALALERVPNIVRHTDGELMNAALLHLVTPRILFPNKAPLGSDSEMVRRYSGVAVAGEESGTSIAFGYVGEAYVDYGLPVMFIPIFLFGLVAGFLYVYVLHQIQHRELAVALATVVFWLTLYQFERSWVKTLGNMLTLVVYLGGMTFLLDRYLLGRRAQMMTDMIDPALRRPA